MISGPPTDWTAAHRRARIRRRHAAERRFRWAGRIAVLLSVSFLGLLLSTMILQGAAGFTETRLRVAVAIPATDGALPAAVEAAAPGLLSPGAWTRVRDAVADDPALRGRSVRIDLPVAAPLDIAAKGRGTAAAEAEVARLGPALSRGLNWRFLTGSDATESTEVGIWGALKGSLLTMAVALALAVPVGGLAALYLEEYAPRNRWTDLIEVSINNLAAVPSIIFGLLGLALFLGLLGLPRSAPLVGGLTLALMTMPVIVIAGRNAIRGVPGSVRDAAYAIGASRAQVVFHHVLPLALPGLMTGAIIGAGRALGETAPLLLIGMRAFIAAPAGGVAEPATVLPVQIFLWSDQVDRGFVEKTSAAIIVLLVLLLAMNAAAIHLRDRFEARR